MGPKKAKSRPESENAGHGVPKWESAIALAQLNDEVFSILYGFAREMFTCPLLLALSSFISLVSCIPKNIIFIVTLITEGFM